MFCSLLLFLNWRVALWVMVGLLLAILGTLICMQFLGLTLNLISKFTQSVDRFRLIDCFPTRWELSTQGRGLVEAIDITCDHIDFDS